MTLIDFASHSLNLCHDGTIHWAAQSMLIVSDLHLEKGSHFAVKGRFLPPYDSRETLGKLQVALQKTHAKRVLFLGDSFHDADGHARLAAEERALLDHLCGTFEVIWVQGNHDGSWVPPCVQQCADYTIDGITFTHEATRKGRAEISGHFHPCVRVNHKGGSVRRPCFIEDGNKLILPSFGAFTGGMDVREAVIAAHFPEPFRVHILGQDRVYSLPSVRLVA